MLFPIPTEFVLFEVGGVEPAWEDVLSPLSIDRMPEDDEGETMFVKEPGLKFGARDSRKEGRVCEVIPTLVTPFLDGRLHCVQQRVRASTQELLPRDWCQA